MQPVVREAQTLQDYAAVSRLIQEYVAWLRARYADDLWFVTEVLDKQSLGSELERLPQMYGPPNGRAFVAVAGGDVLGCGAYRRLDAATCEMKRLFVPGRHRGRGLGRRICGELIASARRDGYASMKLDTGKLMGEAMAMYRSLGFSVCPPYCEYPRRLTDQLVFMERSLDPAGAG